MAQHVKILAALHIVLGCLGVVGALTVLAVFGGIAGLVGFAAHGEDAAVAVPILGFIGGAIAVFVLLISIPGIIAGVGLMKLRPWARILTIVLSALDLLHVPLGTALGIYGLWVMLNPETEALFRSGPAPVRYA